MNLYIVNEIIINGFHSSSLLFLTLAALLSGILVIVSKNPIVSVLFLIGLFLSISIYLMTLGLNFIGLSYLLVYVGAVSILFLFILMLINIRISEITSRTSNSIPLAIIIGTLFFSTVSQALPLPTGSKLDGTKEDIEFNLLPTTLGEQIISYFYNLYDGLLTVLPWSSTVNVIPNYYEAKTQTIQSVSSHVWDLMLAESSHISTLGNILYTSFPLWILLTSLILLLAMVGAIVITLRN